MAVGRQTARKELVQQHAERVDVGSGVDRLSPGLLRRDVVGRAHDHPGGRHPRAAANDTDQTEVDQDGVAGAGVEEDVAGLDVAMNETLSMGRL